MFPSNIQRRFLRIFPFDSNTVASDCLRQAIFASLGSPFSPSKLPTNAIERVNQELKRRTRIASIFPNEASLLRFSSALLAEISDDWDAGKIYLSMNPSFPFSS